MQSQQLSAVFLAAAIWAIFVLGMAFWTPPAAQEGARFAAGVERPPHRAVLLRATSLAEASSRAEARRR